MTFVISITANKHTTTLHYIRIEKNKGTYNIYQQLLVSLSVSSAIDYSIVAIYITRRMADEVKITLIKPFYA